MDEGHTGEQEVESRTEGAVEGVVKSVGQPASEQAEVRETLVDDDGAGVIGDLSGDHGHDRGLALRGVLEAELGPLVLVLPQAQHAGVERPGEADTDAGRHREIPIRQGK